MKRLTIFLLIIFFLLCSAAMADDFSKLQAAIKEKGANWVAKDSYLWRNREKFLSGGGLIPGSPNGPEKMYKPQSKKELPLEFDWRDYNGHNWMTPVKDQGLCGGCGAFGALGAFEAILKYKHNKPDWDIDLSEAHLFFCSGGSCSGGTYQATMALRLQSAGVPDEECMPYTAGEAGEDQNCDDACPDWESRAYKIKDWMWVSYSTPADPETIKQAIYEKGPLYSAIEICDDFLAYESGVYEHVYGNCYGLAHAVTILGWNDTDGYWIGRNSWKVSEDEWWGEEGYFRVKYGQIQVENWLIAFEYDATPSDDDGDDDDDDSTIDDDDTSRREDDSDSKEGCGC